MEATAGIRLIEIRGAFPDSPNALDLRERIELVMRQKDLTFYVRIAGNHVAYAARPLFSRNKSIVAVQERMRIDRIRAQGQTIVESGMAYPEIHFLALSRDDACELMATGYVAAHWFPSGLRVNTNKDSKAQRSHVKAHLPSPICVRSRNVMGTMNPRVHILTFMQEYELGIRLDSVFVDQAKVDHSEIVSKDGDDPLGLAAHAPGVYALFEAARACSTIVRQPGKDGTLRWRGHAQKLLRRSKCDDLFADKTTAEQAAKNIDPQHDKLRNRGMKNGKRRGYCEEQLELATVKAYQQAFSFVNNGLALVIHTAVLVRNMKEKLAINNLFQKRQHLEYEMKQTVKGKKWHETDRKLREVSQQLRRLSSIMPTADASDQNVISRKPVDSSMVRAKVKQELSTCGFEGINEMKALVKIIMQEAAP